MNKLVLTDIDETVLNFTEPFEKWLVEKGWTLRGQMRDNYDLTQLLDCDIDTVMRLVEEFHTLAPEFETLEPEPCASVILPRLKAAGYRFIAISAAVDSEHVRQRRWRNLNNAFGFDWDDCICVGLRQSKARVLEQYEPALWIDDHFKHASDGAEIGHRTFMPTRGYNVGLSHPLVTRVVDWKEINTLLEA